MDGSAALVAARSRGWKDRAVAAEALAAMGDEETDAVLAALLNDEDLAVVKRVAACLLALLASRALERFTGVYAVADNQRGDVMNDELRVAVATHPRLRPALLRLANDGDAGARSALAWFD